MLQTFQRLPDLMYFVFKMTIGQQAVRRTTCITLESANKSSFQPAVDSVIVNGKKRERLYVDAKSAESLHL